ncbi:MAG: glycosyltransferase, partial [Chloroflexi bacterium]|nr:glycosyltransferase [Chloroflexota bacterium]
MSRYWRYFRYTLDTLLVNALILSSLYQMLVYLANRRFWRQPLPPPPASPPPVSVIVPLRGKGPDTLALLHVLAITRPTDDYEVILVLEDEHDPAYSLAQEIAASYPTVARVLLSGAPGEHVGKMHSLNAGVVAARGEWIAFVDANVQVSAELWNAALSALSDPNVGAAYAPPLVREPEHHTGSAIPTGGEMLIALYTNHARTAQLPFAALSKRSRAMPGSFMLVRRRVLDEMGGMLHLLDEASAGIALGRAVREIGGQVVAIPVPAYIIAEPETFNEATGHLLRRLAVYRAYHLPAFLAWPFSNPLTVGFMLAFITEREGRWWGRQTWWFFVWLRLATAYELDRLRFGHSFSWLAY